MMSETMCELCESNKAALQCLSCKIGQKLCADCYKATHHGDNKRTHQIKLFQQSDVVTSYTQVLSILTLEYNCPRHDQKPLEYVCKQCDTVICCDCLLVGEHKGHDATAFADACKDVQMKCQDSLAKEQTLAQRLKEAQDLANQKVKKREEKYRLWAEMVATQFKAFADALKQKEQQISQQLEEEKQKEFGEYEKMFEEICKSQRENAERVKQLQDIVQKKINPQIYKEMKSKAQAETKECHMDLDTPFRGNKKAVLSAEGFTKAMDSLFAFSAGGEHLKKLVPTAAAKYDPRDTL